MIVHCAYIYNSFETVGLTTLFLKNNDDNFIIDENNIKYKNKNYSVIYVETSAPATLSLFSQPIIKNQNQIWKFSYMKRKLMAEIKNPDTIIRCKIIEKPIRRKLHIELFELFAHEINIDYVFENLKLFDNW
jgi:hypothetical protein